MLYLYSSGAFPMADESGVINWYQPKIRTILPLDSFNIPRSLRKFLKTSEFSFRFDYDPITIIKKCADRKETWINDQLISAYQKLHNLGFLHSVETYLHGELAGGLYGIAVGGAFFGESMFSAKSQASKCALVKLVERLNEKNFQLLDVQFSNPHLEMFGLKSLNLDEFLDILGNALRIKTEFT
ncbi:MAG: leucyl/phenylalanyl-tRNA--protein transferase [Ignavibacteriales bacterium]|nr:leucyl/phenylalanyl-tRNA--protein transferase [Ignavibacteriales bacterium]MCF8315786.1 leucyl/phenylalanyl-tRNA--protein transferase [Ignavibacteriales bacterium]MCF8437246.1 leucyl/phenylalanyl-tRNA--protein transferase [Ignavibacteriales bacterium]